MLIVIVVATAIMVMIIPIAVGMPAVAVFVPPPVGVRPAVFARFVQLLARVYHLSALPPVMFRGFVQPVVGPCDATLTSCFIASHRGCAHENERAGQHNCREPRLCPKQVLRLNLHSIPSS
jgi:hypothetical protein